MGYRSTVRGEITFTPGIDLKDAKANEVLASFIGDTDYDLSLISSRDDYILDTIECPIEDEFKAYWLVDNLNKLVTALDSDDAPSRKWSGYLEVHGEGDGPGDIDLWRLKVVNGKAVEIQPKLVWPSDA